MKNKLKKDWDRFDVEHFEKVKEARVKTTTITFRCTEKEKKDFFDKVNNPSDLLRAFINGTIKLK